MKACLALILTVLLMQSANAAVRAVPGGAALSPLIQAAEGCGPGRFRGPGGRCHWMGRERLFERRCPRGYRLGPQDRRCWPN